jgi:hypothetical protein
MLDHLLQVLRLRLLGVEKLDLVEVPEHLGNDRVNVLGIYDLLELQQDLDGLRVAVEAVDLKDPIYEPLLIEIVPHLEIRNHAEEDPILLQEK